MRNVTTILTLAAALSVGIASFAVAQSSTGLSPKGDMQAQKKQDGSGMKGNMKSGGMKGDSGGMKGGNAGSDTSTGSPASGGMTK